MASQSIEGGSMNTSIWIDLFLFGMFLVTGALFILFQSGRIDKLINDGRGADPLTSAPIRYWLYPQKLVRQCGFSVSNTWLWYWSIKASAAILAVLALTMIVPGLPTYTHILTAIAAFFLFDVWLLSKRQKRKEDIELSLEFFVSLMVVYLKSGFSLSMAFKESASHGLKKNNVLGSEVMLIARELEAGRDRALAFVRLAERTGVDDLRRLAVVIETGVSAGAPVIEGLESQADLLRTQQQRRDTLRVNRKSMETMVPMLLICFPVFLVLVFFPAGIQIVETLKMISELF